MGHLWTNQKSGAVCRQCGALRLTVATIAWRRIANQRKNDGQILESSQSKGRGRMVLVFKRVQESKTE